MPKKDRETFVCLGCEITHPLPKGRSGKYCSHTCQRVHVRDVFITQWKAGLISGVTSEGTSAHIHTYLFKKQNGACSKCQNTLWCAKPIPLEFEHKDGNCFNNAEDNVSLLCCNCHSQTPTYKGRNKGNGRLSRAKVVMESK